MVTFRSNAMLLLTLLLGIISTAQSEIRAFNLELQPVVRDPQQLKSFLIGTFVMKIQSPFLPSSP